ncbi:MAG: class I SAM-dependent methyltransferase [Pseudomonadota bacterium]
MAPADTKTSPETPAETPAETASFGFQTVPRGEKVKLVRGVFESVASRYDIMNDLMSGGLHRLWKDHMVSVLDPRPREDRAYHLVDVAGGTGDIAFRVRKRLADLKSADHAIPVISVIDINEAMLRVGIERAEKRFPSADHVGNTDEVQMQWQVGNGEALPVNTRTADAYTIAFGIRNITDMKAALREAYRILRPGGRFLCLEFSPAVLPLIKRAYESYSGRVIPAIGSRVAGDADSYRYLVESIQRFPVPAQFESMVRDAGFKRVRATPMSAGIVRLTQGVRI